jgi:shikimate kinase
MVRRIWLIGMMGAGKTTAASGLAKRLGLDWVDTDDLVTSHAGMAISEIFESRGEAVFRRLEADMVREVAASDIPIVATGGGAVLDETNRVTMKNSGKVVWLRAPVAVLRSRIGETTTRPLLDGDAATTRLEALLQSRSDSYSAAADTVIQSAEFDRESIVDQLEALWKTL